MPKELVGAEKALVSNLWRGDRAAECTGLENRRSESYRGFESHPLRQRDPTMPIYQYRCTNCDTEFTKFMSIREKYSKVTQIFCPACGSIEHTPMISKTSFSLKGKGWYKDGYVKENE